jgi:hypothetical protein
MSALGHPKSLFQQIMEESQLFHFLLIQQAEKITGRPVNSFK